MKVGDSIFVYGIQQRKYFIYATLGVVIIEKETALLYCYDIANKVKNLNLIDGGHTPRTYTRVVLTEKRSKIFGTSQED